MTEAQSMLSSEDFKSIVFNMLIEGTLDYAIFMLNKERNIISWNTGAERILGYQEHEILGANISDFFTQEDSQKNAFELKVKKSIENGRSEYDSWCTRKNGQRFWCTGVIGALLNPEGELQGFVQIMRDSTERRIAEENTYFLANHDVLTRLPNRAKFLEKLHESLINADRDHKRAALLLIDLDHFKSVNDTLGHHAGDQLLKIVAQRLTKCIRETDTVARLGGDEFVVILTRLKSLSTAGSIAHSIIANLSQPIKIDDTTVKIGASIGLAIYPQDGKNSTDLLKKSDLAMYRAKEAGRNCYRAYSPEMLSATLIKEKQHQQLRLAIEREEFELVYQPQVELHNFAIHGAEALLRCRHPDLIAVNPKNIIHLSEELGLSEKIGSWVLKSVFEQIKKWNIKKLPIKKIALNTTALELHHPQYIKFLTKLLHKNPEYSDLLEIEITEKTLLSLINKQSTVLHEIKKTGISICIDDFGSGISSLSYLKDYPIDVLKLDMSLIHKLPENKADSAIVSAITKLALDLDIQVVAEGVETAQQLNFLRTTSCDLLQGFLFSAGLQPEKLEDLMINGKHATPVFH